MLGSARCLDFHEPAARAQARRRMREVRMDGLVVIGGNGSLAGAAALGDPAEDPDPPRIVGVPASIDNDIGLTRMAIGVDTAVNTIVEACDKIADTARAHHRAFFVEVMGRQCGYLAMSAYIAAGADMVLFPEANKSPDDLVDMVVKGLVRASGRQRVSQVLIIVAEGVPISIEDLKRRVDERIAGDPAVAFETRVTVLGHVVRGGRPSGFDRIMASRLSHVAVRGLLATETRSMVGWLPPLELTRESGRRSADDPHCWYLDLDVVLGETKKLLEGTSGAVSWRTRAVDDILEAMLL
jgi:6-phosphofructokinase 1